MHSCSVIIRSVSIAFSHTDVDPELAARKWACPPPPPTSFPLAGNNSSAFSTVLCGKILGPWPERGTPGKGSEGRKAQEKRKRAREKRRKWGQPALGRRRIARCIILLFSHSWRPSEGRLMSQLRYAVKRRFSSNWCLSATKNPKLQKCQSPPVKYVHGDRSSLKWTCFWLKCFLDDRTQFQPN